MTLAHIPRRHSDTAVSKVAGRWMAATPDEHLHTFEDPDGQVSEVGERIVELVDGKRTVAQIACVLVDEFEVSLQQAQLDTLQFVELLVKKQVLAL